jgi:hypothetical protein
MTLTTHRFHSFETMVRAREWLGWIGIPSDQIEVSSTGLPTLSVQTEFARLPEVEMVINAAELTDPDGWPPFDTVDPYQPMKIETTPSPSDTIESNTARIGWHPVD